MLLECLIMEDIVRYHIKQGRSRRLAILINLEQNLKFQLCLKNNALLDYNPQREDFENWIPFTLCLKLPDKCSILDAQVKAAMTVYEIKNFIYGIGNVLEHWANQKKYIYKFNSSESFFELKIEVVLEDDVAEIELWINTGNQTKGAIYGFDEGVRWVTSKTELTKFYGDFKYEFFDILEV